MAKILFSFDPIPTPIGAECAVPPPVYECAPRSFCEPEVLCCPAKTKAKDALRVYNDEVERCFSLNGNGCGRTPIPMTSVCIELRVRLRGACRDLVVQTPRSLNVAGDVCFRWTQEFLQLPEGYYEGDIYVNGKTCHTVGFYLPPCAGRPTSTSVDYAACEVQDPSCCTSLEVDQMNVPPVNQECNAC